MYMELPRAEHVVRARGASDGRGILPSDATLRFVPAPSSSLRPSWRNSEQRSARVAALLSRAESLKPFARPSSGLILDRIRTSRRN